MRITIICLLIILCSFIFVLNNNLKQTNRELQIISNTMIEQTKIFKGDEIK